MPRNCLILLKNLRRDSLPIDPARETNEPFGWVFAMVGPRPFAGRLGADGIAVVALVGSRMSPSRSSSSARRLGTVGDLAAGQTEVDGAAFGVDERVDLLRNPPGNVPCGHRIHPPFSRGACCVNADQSVNHDDVTIRKPWNSFSSRSQNRLSAADEAVVAGGRRTIALRIPPSESPSGTAKDTIQHPPIIDAGARHAACWGSSGDRMTFVVREFVPGGVIQGSLIRKP